MAQGVKYFALVFLLCLIYLSGALIFLKGFLLSRTVIDIKSACEPDFAKRVSPPSHKHEVEGCWMHGRFKKAILIIVDALRYDFLTYNASASETDHPYMNKFQSIDYLLTRKPLHSRLFKFRADPPTTTMQRLKGLTTGSLPTFVDAGSNFQSSEIEEDNWLHQLNEAKKRVKFLGDDTWLGLFPKSFKKSFPFPSFDVKDLHTVDDGILKYLYPEIGKKDWDVIIAHFLGVDHCGHRYGPNHPAMAEKLSQMDNVIRRVTNLIKNDTVVFVMGDHGMTRTGDHGGDSEDELMAGLFIYSPSQLASSSQEKFDDTVAQIDFVPTISLLLGLPIPYSNLGMAIPELFSHCPWWSTNNDVKKVYHKVKALRLNAQQVNAYLDSYLRVSSDLPRRELRSLKERIHTSEKELQALVSAIASARGGPDILSRFVALEQKFISYLTDSRTMCEHVWAKFDMKMIFAGLVTMFLGVVLTVYFLFSFTQDSGDASATTTVPFVVFGMILHILYLAVHIFLLPESVPPVMVFIISLVVIFLCFVSTKAKVVSYFKQTFSVGDALAGVVAVISCSVYFSNSFVVYEDCISQFLLITLLFNLWLELSRTSHSSKHDMGKSVTSKNSKKTKTSFDVLQFLTQSSHIAMVLLLVCGMFIRFSSNFYACREEQHKCEDSFFLIPLSNLDTSLKNQRYLFSIFCLSALVYITRYWLEYYGNSNGTNASVLCLSYAPPIAAVCTCLHWAFQTLPQATLDNIPKWQQVIMAQIVYIAIILSLAFILMSPLLIYILPSRQDSSINLSKGTIPSLYNQIKLQMSQEEEKPPMVYGLGSVYSASIVSLCLVVSLLICLLLNDGIAPSVLFACVSFYLALELYTAATMARQRRGTEPESGQQGQVWSGIVLLSLFSTSYFYATGHQATIPSIRMKAAYTGFYGDFSNFLLPGFLIWTNTFASHIFFGLASPLLIFWPQLSSALSTWMAKEQGAKQRQEGTWRGDFHLFNDGIKLRRRLFHLFTGVLLISGLKMLSAASAATLHRRHLMVWKIFAPRFIYEAAMFATTSICLCLAFLFVLRVDYALSKFVKILPTQKEVNRD